MVSFDGQNFCGKGPLNIFMVKLLLSTRKNYTTAGAHTFINFGGETFAVNFETTKTTKVLPIETYHLYGILSDFHKTQLWLQIIHTTNVITIYLCI